MIEEKNVGKKGRFIMTSIIKNNPVTSSIAALVLVYVINKIPINNWLTSLDFTNFFSESMENVFINVIILLLIIAISRNLALKLGLERFRFNNVLFYTPVILYAFVFSGGFNQISILKTVDISKLLLYTLDVFSSAFLEEVLFRGFILGVILYKFHDKKNGLMKSILSSSLIFGCMHFLNYFSSQETVLKGVLNQVYATFSFGVMYGAVYLKTRNLAVLGVIHGLSNFVAGAGDLEHQVIIESMVESNKSGLEVIVSEIIRLIIFGLPILIGVFIIGQINEKEIEEFVG